MNLKLFNIFIGSAKMERPWNPSALKSNTDSTVY
jgi:hypothetical protein